MELSEVIRHEGDKWVLYTKDGSQVLGTYNTEEEAKAREQQIQFFKSQESLKGSLVFLMEQDALIDTWSSWAGSFSGCVSALSGKPGITDEKALCAWMHHEATGEWPAEEAAKPYVDEMSKALAEMHGGGYGGPGVPNVADCLTACVHRSFTIEADNCYEGGRIDQDERKLLSKMIGDALGLFSAEMDAQLPDLRTRPRRIETPGEPLPMYASVARDLSDTWDRTLTEAKIDKDGNLSGVIVVEGVSSNGNDYTEQALESGREVFAEKSIFLNHPTRTEMRERPERKEEDRVGRLPGPEHIFVEALDDGRKALKFTNGKLSKTADWLATKIREGISGAMSINASGTGHEKDGRFIVEAFTGATSLDFVTEAAAGGQAFLESQHNTEDNTTNLSELTFKSLVEARPDIVDGIASRERRKAYGEKRELGNLREVHKMSKTQIEQLAERVKALEAHNRQLEKDKRRMAADNLVQEALNGQSPQIQQRVRQLVEAPLRAFVEQEELPPGAEAPGDLAPVDPEADPGDPPKIELPPDAALLPEAAQSIFMKTYVVHLGEGEDMAVHQAWVAVRAAGWVKEGDTWTLMAPEEVADAVADVAPEPQPGEPATEETLGEALANAIKAERAYLAEVTGAGNIAGMGAGAQPSQAPTQEQAHAALVEAFIASGMSEAQAKVAAAGRPARRGV